MDPYSTLIHNSNPEVTYMMQNPHLFPPRGCSTYVRPTPKIRRNDPCPCGSGKKYKLCCYNLYNETPA